MPCLRAELPVPLRVWTRAEIDPLRGWTLVAQKVWIVEEVWKICGRVVPVKVWTGVGPEEVWLVDGLVGWAVDLVLAVGREQGTQRDQPSEIKKKSLIFFC